MLVQFCGISGIFGPALGLISHLFTKNIQAFPTVFRTFSVCCLVTHWQSRKVWESQYFWSAHCLLSNVCCCKLTKVYFKNVNRKWSCHIRISPCKMYCAVCFAKKSIMPDKTCVCICIKFKRKCNRALNQFALWTNFYVWEFFHPSRTQPQEAPIKH